MTARLAPRRLTRRAVVKGGALTVGFAFAGLRTQAQLHAQADTAGPRSLDPKELDSFLAVDGGGVTLFCGKVDLGQGLRIAMRQIAGEELGIGIDKIKYVEGDTALTPDQGRTSGSNGIQRGGMQVRHAAATAREALIAIAAQRLNMRADDLVAADGRGPFQRWRRGHSLRRSDRRPQLQSQAQSQGAAQGPRDLYACGSAIAAARTCRPNAPAL